MQLLPTKKQENKSRKFITKSGIWSWYETFSCFLEVRFELCLKCPKFSVVCRIGNLKLKGIKEVKIEWDVLLESIVDEKSIFFRSYKMESLLKNFFLCWNLEGDYWRVSFYVAWNCYFLETATNTYSSFS